MTTMYDPARFIGVAIATAMNELDISLTLPSAEGVVRPNPESSTPAKKKAKSSTSKAKKTASQQRAAEMPEDYRRALKESKKAEPKAPAKKKASSKKKVDPLAPRKSKKSASPKPKRRTPKENSRIVHEVNGYLGMAKKAKTQAGARIWLLKATKATPSGWTATHNQIARKHALHCPDIAA